MINCGGGGKARREEEESGSWVGWLVGWAVPGGPHSTFHYFFLLFLSPYPTQFGLFLRWRE